MNEASRFYSRISPEPNTGCWLWTGSTFGVDGYGAIRFDGKTNGAHRLSWLLHRGPIPGGQFVLHRCDVRPCCNPDHLFLGTQADNVRDRVAKGRSARGFRNGHYTRPDRTPRGDRHGMRLHPERVARGSAHGSRTRPEKRPRGEIHGMAKLTPQDVEGIRAARLRGLSFRAIGELFGITATHAHGIVSRKNWRTT